MRPIAASSILRRNLLVAIQNAMPAPRACRDGGAYRCGAAVSKTANKTGATRPPNCKSIDRADHFIVGMTNSAPLLMPDGQRAVTVLVFVQNLIESVPCWLRSPKLDAFQPPKEW